LLPLAEETDSLIDLFISDRQNNNDNKLDEKFEQLLKNIVANQQSAKNLIIAKHDVDVLFKDKRSGIYYYIEVKYNDDLDTGKFIDINRRYINSCPFKALSIKNV